MTDLNLTTGANKGQNMQNAYNPTHLITTYQSIFNSPLKSQIENEYSSYPLPQFSFPINFSVTFDFPNPDIPGYLSSTIDHIISILDAKPSLLKYANRAIQLHHPYSNYIPLLQTLNIFPKA